MAWYVTMISNADTPHRRVAWLAGPFNLAGSAARTEPIARRFVVDRLPQHSFDLFGITHVRNGRSIIGRLNDRIDLPEETLP